MSNRRKTFNTPVLPMEYPLEFGDEIKACPDCLPWSVEIVRDHPSEGDLTVREWHAEGCEFVKEE